MYQCFLTLWPTGSMPIMVIIYFFVRFSKTSDLVTYYYFMYNGGRLQGQLSGRLPRHEKGDRIYFSSEFTGLLAMSFAVACICICMVACIGICMVACRSTGLTTRTLWKREVLAVISSMEGDYNAILDWRSSTGSVPPGATTQWGSSIIIAGEVKRIHGSKRKSFMADMYSFANDGELQAIKAYLLSHGNFEIEQVTLQRGGYTTCPFEQST